MEQFTCKDGVNAFEAMGPEGLLRVEAGSPFVTGDPGEIAALDAAGSDALNRSAAPKAEAAKAEKPAKDGDA